MTPKFSLLHATYGRPEKAIEAMKRALGNAAISSSVEYIFAVNNDDSDKLSIPIFILEHGWPHSIQIIRGDFAGSAAAWDAAAKASSGSVLIQMQDDLELPGAWDYKLHERLWEHDKHFDRASIFVGVSDGYRDDALCCTAIMTRERYRQQGEFLHPGYVSVFSDDDVTYRALRDAREKKCTFLEARDLVFLHRHHYHDKSVPMDSTYERENSAEAYRIGQTLFMQRNPEAISDGLKTW
jgi:hypothetical protein